MLTTFARTTFCSMIITVLMATSVHAQLSSVFGGNHGGGGGQRQGQNSLQHPRQQMQQQSQRPAAAANLVGRWYTAADVDGGRLEVLYVFNADSTMMLGLAKTPNQGKPETGKFTGRYQLNGDMIQLNFDDGDVENYRVRLNGDQLTLVGDGKSFTFSRLQQEGRNPNPAPRTSSAPTQNPHAGNWVLYANGNGTTVQGHLDLNANGTYQLSMNVTGANGTSQTALSGRWRIEGNFIVFETDGEVEQLPIQFDGKRLAIDIAEWGVRTVFARDIQNSYVEPLASN